MARKKLSGFEEQLKNEMLKNIGEFLKKAREKSGQSQGEVAREAGLASAQFISNVERGLSLPSPQLLKVMVKLYRMNVNDLINFLANEKRDYAKALYTKLLKGR
ncbi:MAG: helix-turn-helix domain-containing protein [Bdellovibrionaceae bacterium]|nr:helix-turn-helix domain-containing protein [Pseudobdellovibrionaceae bacterium]